MVSIWGRLKKYTHSKKVISVVGLGFRMEIWKRDRKSNGSSESEYKKKSS